MNEKRERCGFCEDGVIQVTVRFAHGDQQVDDECPYCAGTGYVQEQT